eukprot:CAMPEP_0197447692 /NCGR_PEP_ID=MMETSP1175-20131217/14317_1 /TAXON_ID=1003142 /ORGANISM="Triceratium dubium, Strain CCMP147" /LENGTH=84 /DNA_ID=CAMNT_0042979137 /DNA_START=1 /DNA_END=252 /DNA_ORIENTATION=+
MMITPPSSPGFDRPQVQIPITHQAVIPPVLVPSSQPSYMSRKFDPTAASDKALLVEDYVSASSQPQCASTPGAEAVPHGTLAVP